jgi:hypothetical protein
MDEPRKSLPDGLIVEEHTENHSFHDQNSTPA